MRRIRAFALAAVVLLAGCASAGTQPNTASDPTAVPGGTTTPGDGSSGSISVTGTSVVRTGTQLVITTHIHNSGSTADELDQVSSQVSPTVTLNPSLAIPPGATRTLGAGGVKVVLQQQLRLESGATVALMLQFHNAGEIQVFSGFAG